LRFWRGHRHLSQLGLALAADVSSRHVSFMETGRARPSADMVARLAEVLDVPLRERNALFLAAGFAPEFRETGLVAPEMSQARRAMEFILKQQDPFPAFVLTRHWDLVTTNESSMRVFGWLLEGRVRNRNIMRSVFDPNGLRPMIVNWEEVAQDMIRHLYHQVTLTPTDARGVELLNEILASPGLPRRWTNRDFTQRPAPLLTAIYRRDGRELRFFSTLTTFGTPLDVTLEELRIECSFPGDDSTEQFCRALAAGESGR
jgi:transcriptional regulator with XRE-family HTH domain